MKFIALNEISDLNHSNELEAIGCKVHVRDSCGGQYFPIEVDDAKRADAAEIITKYFSEKGTAVKFDPLMKGFSVKQ